MADYELVQLNIARMLAPADSPQLADFFANLDRINQLADSAPGFIWRLQDESGSATDFRPYDDDVLVNMSVWRDIESLRNYVYRSAHVEIMRRRKEWFELAQESYIVLWWIAAGSIPSVEQAKQKLALLREHGPSVGAFTFNEPFPPPSDVEQ